VFVIQAFLYLYFYYSFVLINNRVNLGTQSTQVWLLLEGNNKKRFAICVDYKTALYDRFFYGNHNVFLKLRIDVLLIPSSVIIHLYLFDGYKFK
jgi:hypothetical protein